jgi:hypothetical protein
MATFKEISAADVKTSKSALNQLVDVIQEDVSGSATRRAYQVFVTGSGVTSVTSSLFQTVYDQDYTLQTANPVFDMTESTIEKTFTKDIANRNPDLLPISAYSSSTKTKLSISYYFWEKNFRSSLS